MPRFFENICLNVNDEFAHNEDNSKHSAKVLRMKLNDDLTVCNGAKDYECKIINITADSVICKVNNIAEIASEPSVSVTLYQCLPKGDKFETVIQKSVELGVKRIVPVLSSRCVSRPDDKKGAKKIERYNKIAKSACEQSGRGEIVEVCDIMGFDKALSQISDSDLSIMFYEGGGKSLKQILGNFDNDNIKNIAVLIGPEGGFSEDEVKKSQDMSITTATLGKRILRTETAPLAALTAIMLLTDNME